MGCLITNVYLANAKKSQVKPEILKLLYTIKKDSLLIFKPHRTVLINNKTTKLIYYVFINKQNQGPYLLSYILNEMKLFLGNY